MLRAYLENLEKLWDEKGKDEHEIAMNSKITLRSSALVFTEGVTETIHNGRKVMASTSGMTIRLKGPIEIVDTKIG